MSGEKERKEDALKEKKDKVHQLILQGLQAQASATFYSDGNGDMDVLAKTMTDDIVKLFV